MNKPFWFLAIIMITIHILFSPLLFAQTQIAIKCGQLFDVLEQEVRTDMVIFIEDNKITAVEKSAEIPSNTEIIDLTDYAVLPGLIDAHTHLMLHGDFCWKSKVSMA